MRNKVAKKRREKMIGRLQGILLEKKPPQLLLNVSGVGYEVQAPMSTFYRLPDVGQEIVLITHLVVREDAQILFGFSQERERTLFRSLIKVSNIGPKSALTILSGIEPDVFVRCIMESDAASLSRLPGIGKKTAERLVIEMRDRLDDWQENAGTNETLQFTSTANAAVEDAISALISLGYKPQDARRAVQKIEKQDVKSEELIRLALRNYL
jgi:Holliday junction DNA helicase RuvA